jgi:hypothetical protein
MNPAKWDKAAMKLSIFLIFVILSISLSFLISGCGSGPGTKTQTVSEYGTYALDFNQAPRPWPAAASVVLGRNGLNYTAIKNHVAGSAAAVVIGTDGNDYRCILNHQAAAGNRPISGAWATYWAATGGTGLGVVWVSGTWYNPGDGGSGGTEPFLGPTWQTYWVQQGSGGAAWVAGNSQYYFSFKDVGSVSLGKSTPRLNDLTSLTLESWIKSATTTPYSTLHGGIFSRADDYSGCVLFVDGQLKFAMKRRDVSSTSYMVNSGFTVSNALGWTHVASVLADADHTGVHTVCGAVGNGTAIAIDAANKQHIAYYGNASLNYITNASGAWVKTVIESTGSTDVRQPSIVIDTAATPSIHISYVDEVNGLKYATKTVTGGSWSVAAIDQNTGVGRAGYLSSIAKDSSNNPHIAYHYYQANADAGYTLSIRYATNSGVVAGTGNCPGNTNWNCATVATQTVVGADITSVNRSKELSFPSLAIDASNVLHMAYGSYHQWTGSWSDQLKYATCAASCSTPSNWTITNIENDPSGGNSYKWTSIAIDSAATPYIHVAYMTSGDNNDLKYATKTVTGGSWSTAIVVDSVGITGKYASITVNATSTPYLHTSYYDVTNGNLNYATCSSTCTTAGNWTKTTVDTTGDVGSFTSIKRDTAGTPYLHMAYYDATNRTLKYATKPVSGGSWAASAIDQNGAEARAPHMDIYVNGVFKDCRAGVYPGESTANSEQIGRSSMGWADVMGTSVDAGTRLEGIIDEVRFWNNARSLAMIQQCMSGPLGMGGTCGITNGAIGYWKFNEGSGTTIMSSGTSQNGGNKNYCTNFDRNGDSDVTDVVYSDAPVNTIVDCSQSDTNCAGASAVCSSELWYSGWTSDHPF